MRFWFLGHRTGNKRGALRSYYEEHIDNAKESITLITPYLIPSRWLIARLHQALLRGVHIEIIVPRNTDYFIIDKVNRHFLSLFNKLGATCLIMESMNHAKVAKESLVPTT
jgi:cardiolipin synthase